METFPAVLERANLDFVTYEKGETRACEDLGYLRDSAKFMNESLGEGDWKETEEEQWERGTKWGWSPQSVLCCHLIS